MTADGERVVITGIGAVSTYGWSSADLWRGLLSGKSGIRIPTRFCVNGQRTALAAEVPAPPAGIAARIRGFGRLSQADRFAVAAACEAAEMAGVAPWGADLAVYFGGSTAGMAESERFFHSLFAGEGRPELHLLASQPLNGPGDAVARCLGATGEVLSLSSACASGALALAEACFAVRSGEAQVAIAGASDSLCALTYSGFNALRAVDLQPCRPFRKERAGLSLGEGAGAVVLESLAHARERGAHPLAELRGAGATCDAYHMTAPDPEGRGAAAAIQSALAESGVGPGAVDFVNAHGTGTPHNDFSEWRALVRVFGEGATAVPVTSTKSAVGHLLGAAGAIEAVVTVLCLRAGWIHPTMGEGTPDSEAAADLVTGNGRKLARGGCAISTSFAFGGANAALVLSDWPAEPAR